MNAIVIYESLTGNTAEAGRRIGAELTAAGVDTTVCPITRIDYDALSRAELVIVGSWVDGALVVGQRPGRAGRLRRMPTIAGKRAVVYCTFAIHPGRTLEKLQRIVESRGGEVVGGMAIHRTRIGPGAQELVDRLLSALAST